MSIITEPTPKTIARQEAALMVINGYKAEVDDRFRVEPLEVEFPSFAAELGGNIWLARAGDNQAGAFKWRGAMYAAYKLKRAGYEHLAIASAGNAARGAALAARALNLSLHVVVPATAPPEKSQGVLDLWPGGKIKLTKHGHDFNQANDYLTANPGLGRPIPAFDDLDVIAGQGTLVDDILKLLPQAKHIVGTTGGGSLAAGILSRRDSLDRGDIGYYAVEATGSDSASRSLESGRLELATNPNQLYGGSAVRALGYHTLEIIRNSDNFTVIANVSDAEIARLIDSYIYDRQTNLLEQVTPYEPTTLVGVAGLARVVANLRRQGRDEEPVVVIGTGHNAPLLPQVTSRGVSQIMSWQK